MAISKRTRAARFRDTPPEQVTWPMVNELVDPRLRFAFRAMCAWRARTPYRSKGAFEWYEPTGFIPEDKVLKYTVYMFAPDSGIGPKTFERAGLIEPHDWREEPGHILRHPQLLNPFKHLREPIPAALRKRVMERDGGMCQHCGTAERPTLDHIIPYSHGGPDTEDNLQVLCKSCNSRKGARV